MAMYRHGFQGGLDQPRAGKGLNPQMRPNYYSKTGESALQPVISLCVFSLLLHTLDAQWIFTFIALGWNLRM